jgi:tetratricopeptide (TPR) repeat protein
MSAYTPTMHWAIAAAIVALLIYRFLSEPSRKVKVRCFSALHACNRKNWKLAAKFYSEAYEIAHRLKEPLRSKMESEIEVQWARVLYRQGDLRAAEDMVSTGLSKGERYFASESEMLLQARLCWGDLCMDEGRYSEAEAHYRKALESDESSDNLAGMIFDLERLSTCLIQQVRQAEAELAIECAITVETRHAREFAFAHGVDPDQYLLTPTSLAKLHFCREQYEDARRLYRAQIEHWETVAKRPDNIDLGELHIQLALAEARTGHFEEAFDAYEKAAAEFEREWCAEHPKVIAVRNAKETLETGAAAIQPSSRAFQTGKRIAS